MFKELKQAQDIVHNVQHFIELFQQFHGPEVLQETFDKLVGLKPKMLELFGNLKALPLRQYIDKNDLRGLVSAIESADLVDKVTDLFKEIGDVGNILSPLVDHLRSEAEKTLKSKED